MKRCLLLLSLVALIAGCCSFEKCESVVGKKPPEIRYIEVPPRTEWIVPPAVQCPPRPRLSIFDWTDEQIKADPVGYQEALFTDLDYLDSFALHIIEYLHDLELARERAIERAQSTNDDPPQP